MSVVIDGIEYEPCEEGYIQYWEEESNNHSFDNVAQISVNSAGLFRSAIYASALEHLTEGATNAKFLRFTGGVLADSPFTAIGIAMSAREEGIIQATVTGILSSGITTTIGIMFISPIVSTAGLPVAAAFATGVIATIVVGLITDYAIDATYDYLENKFSKMFYNDKTKDMLIQTNIENIKDIKSIIGLNIQYGEGKIKNIQVEQSINQETIKYTIKKGDTIWDICRQYGITQDELLKMNPWLEERFSQDKTFVLIRPDEKLLIPNGSVNINEGSPTGLASDLFSEEEIEDLKKRMEHERLPKETLKKMGEYHKRKFNEKIRETYSGDFKDLTLANFVKDGEFTFIPYDIEPKQSKPMPPSANYPQPESRKKDLSRDAKWQSFRKIFRTFFLKPDEDGKPMGEISKTDIYNALDVMETMKNAMHESEITEPSSQNDIIEDAIQSEFVPDDIPINMEQGSLQQSS